MGWVGTAWERASENAAVLYHEPTGAFVTRGDFDRCAALTTPQP